MPRSVTSDDALLTAAGRLFRRQGFAATSLREIAAEAGVLLGSLQYRYRTKDELLVALMRRGMNHALSSLAQVSRTTTDPLERIRMAMRAHLELLITLDDATYVLLYEWRSLARRSKASVILLRDEYEARWHTMLREAQAAGVLDATLDLRMVRLLILGLMNWIPQWYDPRQAKSLDDVADGFWQIILHGAAARAGTGSRRTRRR